MRHLSVGHAEPLRAELQSFVSAVRENKMPPVSGEEGVESLDVAMRCLENRQGAKTTIRRSEPRRAAG
jgi:predicted dehydrogenase